MIQIQPGWISPSSNLRVEGTVLSLADSVRPAVFVTEFVLAGLPAGAETARSVVTSFSTSGDRAEIGIRTRAGDWILTLGGPPGNPALRSTRTRPR